MVPGITTAGHILAPDGWKYADCMLDTFAEVNLISQSYVKQNDLQACTGDLPKPQSINGQPVYCYGAYSLQYRLVDSWGQLRACNSVFYAIEKPGSPIVLGMPALKEACIQMDLGAREWRFPVEVASLSMSKPLEFMDHLAGEPTVYTVVIAGAEYTNSRRGDGDTPIIPDGLHDLGDVFSSEKAGHLPPLKEGDHAIDLDGHDPPYSPIYNLSQRELEVLRTYLDDALAKG